MDQRAYAREVEDVDYWRALCPTLHVTDRPPIAGHAPPIDEEWSAERKALIELGYVQRDGVLSPGAAAELAACVGRLQAAGKHPVFAFVYDELWGILERLAPIHAAILGAGYEVVPDFWAWKLDPGRGGGWSPHRGWYENVAGPDGLPALINVWVALTDVTPLSACMHVVPLCDDPGFPDQLSRAHPSLERARALPVPAGAALIWSANALHWGGACSERAPAPRVSVSFAARRGAVGPPLAAVALGEPLPFKKRLDLIADQVLAYADREPDATAPALRWATLVASMHDARR